MTDTARIAAVVLAAGRATRYRAADASVATKLVATFRGEPLVRHVVAAALASVADPVIVVTGHAAAEVGQALVGLEVRVVHNPAFADGLATSLRRGLAALPETVAGVLVLLGDMPLVDAATLDTLIAAARHSLQADAVVPVHAGQRGNPVLLGRSLFAAADKLTGDEGARRLLRDPALTVIEIPLADPAVRLDIDDPAALAHVR